MSLDIFKKVNKLTASKKYNTVLYIVAVILVIYIVLKKNNITFNSAKKHFKDVSVKVSKAKEDAGGEEEITAEKMRKKIEEVRRRGMRKIEKKENEKNNKEIKKEIIPEVVIEGDKTEDIKPEDTHIVKKEEKIIEPISIFSKLNQFEEKYKERMEKKQIRYGKVIKINDVIYYNMSISNTITYNEGEKTVEKVVDGGEGGKIIFKVAEGVDMTKYFLNKKVGDTFSMSAKEMIRNFDELSESISQKSKNDKNYRGVELDISKFKYTIKILDIIPKSVLKELKLDTYL
jgi:hypothetical protein